MRPLVTGAVLGAALALAGCVSDPGLKLAGGGQPTSDAVELYKLYARRCSSQFSVPWAASVTCERLQDDNGLSARMKGLEDRLDKLITALQPKSGE